MIQYCLKLYFLLIEMYSDIVIYSKELQQDIN